MYRYTLKEGPVEYLFIIENLNFDFLLYEIFIKIVSEKFIKSPDVQYCPDQNSMEKYL